MIEKLFVCDLCDIRLVDYKTNKRPAQRLRFHDQSIILCSLEDSAASEKVVCGACLNALAVALRTAIPPN